MIDAGQDSDGVDHLDPRRRLHAPRPVDEAASLDFELAAAPGPSQVMQVDHVKEDVEKRDDPVARWST